MEDGTHPNLHSLLAALMEGSVQLVVFFHALCVDHTAVLAGSESEICLQNQVKVNCLTSCISVSVVILFKKVL